ncbi:hypothetical protein Gbro_2998 [Gordonia bronchialis DSM 43247]|uniref:Low molecular weight antigen MTB12-like C-terminal domain-containing protein n=1 Tax=Gordonia bronchialis (strain ATCC 25592 / DSM 43247 / BCRC 13721 / JCM 3198 / KCTC 3076 / NBRC 16047 / NCTC 10667) TaxID=526226 RepID=D0LAR3_GORB4|nr:hypothetical protein [Gordonia bronchialis]ACY22206.1 hypothetical protein Gbro_2998 [Gordonia bronchialis DSM 43247]MCC3324996.1 hypothetical protein [Gordonia bronchialis]QGS24248.1 hypothetical protein FOB84_08795 [Gordonia bronchialis]UAK39552.1 hypothetical protein K8O93_07820 [Gordonia bronchialis]
MIAAALLTVAACGSDDNDSPPVPSVAATSANGSGTSAADQRTDGSKPPTAQTIEAMINEALDPNVPNAQKVLLVEGAERDPDIFDKLVQAKEENQGISYAVTNPPIRQGPNKARVTVQVTSEGNPPTPVEATIVYQQGRWKLSNATVCTLLSAYQVESPMCPGSTTSSRKSSTRPSN